MVRPANRVVNQSGEKDLFLSPFTSDFYSYVVDKSDQKSIAEKLAVANQNPHCEMSLKL